MTTEPGAILRGLTALGAESIGAHSGSSVFPEPGGQGLAALVRLWVASPCLVGRVSAISIGVFAGLHQTVSPHDAGLDGIECRRLPTLAHAAVRQLVPACANVFVSMGHGNV